MKRFSFLFVIAAIQIVVSPQTMAQRTGPAPQSARGKPSNASAGTADLLITLRDEKNSELTQLAKVTLRNSKGVLPGGTISAKGRVLFRALALDSYEVDVEVPGFSTTRATVSLQLAGETHAMDITIAAPGVTLNGPPPPPSLTLREQKELTAGLRALQAQNISSARKHFRSAAKTNPNHPDVDYLLGVIASMTGDVVSAKQYLENAAARYQHVRSLTALGEIYLIEGNLGPAEARLKDALKADPNSWRAEQLLAAVELREHSYSDAVRDAEQALALGKTEAKGARLTLAEALSASGNLERATQILNELLKQNPTREQEKAAIQLLEANRQARVPPSAQGDAISVSYPSTDAVLSIPTLPLAPSLPPVSDNPLADHSRWAPPNVDDGVPPVQNGATCPLPLILQRTGQRVLEFADNLERFSATERLKHQALNEFGLAVRTEQLNFNYLVAIREVKPGVFDVSEFRDGTNSAEVFPEHIATLGTVALVFVFHPNYADDFDFQCEGQTYRENQPTWQVHFQQKIGRPSRLRSYRLGTKYFRVGIKGRAWISADSFQVVRMESDLVTQVPELRLNAEHQDITYGPVSLKQKQLVLWLPYSADIYLDFDAHRIHRRQDLSNYVFFWVEDQRSIEKPKESQAPEAKVPSG
ncbi:MAG TPA: tetratricopeptide repeat protein [Candidatus Acidoferrum sp.]|nr:tetratricopeptide repeat protein [Candidatus Acidoferrum sp.]